MQRMVFCFQCQVLQLLEAPSKPRGQAVQRFARRSSLPPPIARLLPFSGVLGTPITLELFKAKAFIPLAFLLKPRPPTAT